MTGEAAETAPAPAGAPARFEDPIGDVSDGEGWTYTGEGLETDADSEAEAYRAGVAVDAVDGTLESHPPGAEADLDEHSGAEPARVAEDVARGRERVDSPGTAPPARLERLQKILSQAGIASRRHAEEMIVAGRVAVNGQIVTTLGSKADPERDHIRVDGKLLHGSERHRYFVLHKPKGYVTTVSDPEGRPTVMEFVSRLGERVYPVGRLDFQSEGLLLMTNDGGLANQLTRASSGVEKTYLVKVAGQPDEEALERLRNGVLIERGGLTASGLHGSGGRVRTAPARIRQIRPGENPWYEVVLTEGRNRELRKMFSAVGHYVEKIRRVGYGPLVLDIAPGKLRELSLEEVDALRQTAEGKLKPPRLKTEAMLPKEAGRAADSRPAKREGWRPSATHPAKPFRRGQPERGGQQDFRRHGEQRSGAGDFRGQKQESFGPRDRSQRQFPGERREWQPRPRPREDQPDRRSGPREPRKGFDTRGQETRRFERSDRGFDRRREERSGAPEDREFRARPNRPGARWERSAGERPFRPEGRTVSGEHKNRYGGPAKFSGKGQSGSFGDERGGHGPVGFAGKRKPDGGRGPVGFSGKRKPGRFRAGPRPGGRRPGGKPRS
ncbi:MAG TPA: pseudouridine synthase [Terracidiphilus sp.]|nr:pseudouridine synthase [Terracidiphilus sp.]